MFELFSRCHDSDQYEDIKDHQLLRILSLHVNHTSQLQKISLKGSDNSDHQANFRQQ